MATNPYVDHDALLALASLASVAGQNVAIGLPDDLIVPRKACPVLPGEQDDDDVRAIASIDVLRYLVDHYEATVINDDSMTAWPHTDEEKASFADWQSEVADGNTTLGWRHWLVTREA